MISATTNLVSTAATKDSTTIFQYFLKFTAKKTARQNHKKYSKYSNVKDLAIIYTTMNNVQKTEVIGSVLTSNIKTIQL